MNNEQIILDLQAKGDPFLINFGGENGAVFFGTDTELKTLAVLAIKTRTSNLEEAQKWVNDIQEALSECDSREN